MTAATESDEQFVERITGRRTDGEFKYNLVLENEDADRALALMRRGAAMQWRPIEEAPKDGTHFLAIRGGGSSLPNAICWNPWLDNFSGDYAPNGKPVVYQPTHWMPLPEPPAGENP